jgi:hypothetical protein
MECRAAPNHRYAVFINNDLYALPDKARKTLMIFYLLIRLHHFFPGNF